MGEKNTRWKEMERAFTRNTAGEGLSDSGVLVVFVIGIALVQMGPPICNPYPYMAWTWRPFLDSFGWFNTLRWCVCVCVYEKVTKGFGEWCLTSWHWQKHNFKWHSLFTENAQLQGHVWPLLFDYLYTWASQFAVCNSFFDVQLTYARHNQYSKSSSNQLVKVMWNI